VVLLGVQAPAWGQETKTSTTTTTVKGAAPPDLKAVVDGFQSWLLGFATALAILTITVAGIYYLFSAGNPAQVERAKLIIRATVIGYSLMVLARIVVQALQGIVG
jgi:Type IV secretion system pilin